MQSFVEKYLQPSTSNSKEEIIELINSNNYHLLEVGVDYAATATVECELKKLKKISKSIYILLTKLWRFNKKEHIDALRIKYIGLIEGFRSKETIEEEENLNTIEAIIAAGIVLTNNMDKSVIRKATKDFNQSGMYQLLHLR